MKSDLIINEIMARKPCPVLGVFTFLNPLLLPQKDPAFYDSFLKTYSVPEFVVEPVRTREKDLADAVRSPAQIEVTMPLTSATPKAGPSDPWQQIRE